MSEMKFLETLRALITDEDPANLMCFLTKHADAIADLVEAATDECWKEDRSLYHFQIRQALTKLEKDRRSDDRRKIKTTYLCRGLPIQGIVDMRTIVRDRRNVSAAPTEFPEPTATEFAFCCFHGDPPQPYSNWGAWTQSKPHMNVFIRALKEGDLSKPAAPQNATPKLPNVDHAPVLAADLHILRNPWGYSIDTVRQERLRAADEIEYLRARLKPLQP